MTNKPNGKNNEESLIEFPCKFVIKVMGKNNDNFEKSVLNIITKHFPDFDKKNMAKKFSKDSNYLSLSITVFAQSKAQLDSAYQDLSSCENVLMSL